MLNNSVTLGVCAARAPELFIFLRVHFDSYTPAKLQGFDSLFFLPHISRCDNIKLKVGLGCFLGKVLLAILSYLSKRHSTVFTVKAGN